MELRFSPEAPGGATGTVSQHLHLGRDHPAFAWALGPGWSAADVHSPGGVPVWQAHIRHLAQARLHAFSPTGQWRYPLLQGEEVLGEVHLVGHEAGARVVSVTRGLPAEGLARGLARAATLPGAPAEPRLVVNHSAHLHALWLVREGGEDLFMPLPGDATGLAHLELVDPATFQAAVAVRATAQHRLHQSRRPPPHGGA